LLSVKTFLKAGIWKPWNRWISDISRVWEYRNFFWSGINFL